MDDLKRNPNGQWQKGQTGNPGGIPGGGQPGNAGGGSRMAYVKRLQEAIGRGNLKHSDLHAISLTDSNSIKRAAASHLLTQIIKNGDDASMIRERARPAADLDDRTEGKPIGRMQIDQRVLMQRISAAPGDDRTAAEIAAEIRSFIFAPANDDAAPALPVATEVEASDVVTVRQEAQATRDATTRDD